jgi:tetratricopeptide (TPR) repeat protein
LHALLQAQAAGHPYSMEALLQMLVDTGVVRVEADTWQVQADRLHDLKVPPTLVGVLQATLDALEDGERRSLQQASVVGALFWDEALAAIDEQAPAQLPGLSERALTLPQAESAFQGAHAYQFRHHRLHQVTYGTVLKTDRRQAHARAARWLQSRSPGREQELAGQIAEHFERAGEAEPATAYWLAAAEHAARRQSDLAAVAHADRALALMDRAGGLIDAAPVDVGQDTRHPDPALDRERRLRLHRVRCDVFLRGGDAERHDREIAVLETLAEPGGDEDLRLAYDHAWRLSNDGRYADAAALIEERLSRADEATRRRAGRLNGMLFVCLVHTGREDDALAHADRSLAAARADGDLSSVGALHNNLGVTHMQASRVDLTISHYRQALEAYQTTGNRQGQVTVRMNLAQVELMRGHYAAASELLQDSLGVSRGIGSRRLEAMVCANLSVCLSALEEPQAAYDTALEGIRLSRLAGETRTEAWGHNGAETAAGLLGRHTEALAHACAARDGFRTHHDAATAWTHAAAAVRHLQALGRIEEARTEADALLAEVEAQGGWGGGYEGAYNLYVALAPLGDARAPGLLACAHEALCLQADRLAAHVEREAYLRCHAVHRSIVAAWATMQSGSDRAWP